MTPLDDDLSRSGRAPDPHVARRQWRMGLLGAFATALLSTVSPTVAAASGPGPPPAAVQPPRPLPPIRIHGYVDRADARIWYGSLGFGPPVILLHGGLSSSRAWGEQVGPLLAAGYRVVVVDSRGHGRSTLGPRRLSYELMADDVLAVMDRLKLRKPSIVGWSDGAIVALMMATRHGDQLCRVFAFGANTEQSGVRAEASLAPVLQEIEPRLAADHAALSGDPGGFAALRHAVRAMQSREPIVDTRRVAGIRGPEVMVAAGDRDEFITSEHSLQISRTIPGARLHMFRGAGHFAPWQRSDDFNRAVIGFLGEPARRCP